MTHNQMQLSCRQPSGRSGDQLEDVVSVPLCPGVGENVENVISSILIHLLLHRSPVTGSPVKTPLSGDAGHFQNMEWKQGKKYFYS